MKSVYVDVRPFTILFTDLLFPLVEGIEAFAFSLPFRS